MYSDVSNPTFKKRPDMKSYNFQTSEFGVSENGIHFLRSGFNYKTIDFAEINRIQIQKGKELHNWWVIFIIGAVLIGLGVYLSIGIIEMFVEGNVAPRNAKMIFLLLIPVAGGYFVYNSLQTGLILKIDSSKGERNMFPLKEIIRDKKLTEFKTYLRDRVGTKVQVAV